MSSTYVEIGGMTHRIIHRGLVPGTACGAHRWNRMSEFLDARTVVASHPTCERCRHEAASQ
jgi:hypothetical protein